MSWSTTASQPTRPIPPRLHDQHLLVTGNPVGSSGAIQSLDTNGDPVDAPLGPNMLTGHEDRFSDYTFQIATQTDGLNHVGVGTTYYNGVQFDDMLAAPRHAQARAARTSRPSSPAASSSTSSA